MRTTDSARRLDLILGRSIEPEAIIDHANPAADDCLYCGEVIGAEPWCWKRVTYGYSRAHSRCDTECPACGAEWSNLNAPCPSCGTTIEDVAERVAESQA